MAQRKLVVAAVIVDASAQPPTVLAARRSSGAEALRGFWEFPGGKVEPCESPQDALRRELAEELAVEIRVLDEIGGHDGAWPISEELELRLFLAAVVAGEPVPGPDHDEIRWLATNEFDELRWLPSDAAALADVVRRLR